MKRIALASALVLAGSVLAFAAGQRAAAAGSKDGRIVFDVTNGDGPGLLDRLEAIDGTRRDLAAAGITPHIVVSFRGGATVLVQKDASKAKPEDRPFLPKIAAKLAEMGREQGLDGAEQCGAAAKRHGTDPAAVVPPIKVVANSFVSIMEHQAKGYAYIRP